MLEPRVSPFGLWIEGGEIYTDHDNGRETTEGLKRSRTCEIKRAISRIPFFVEGVSDDPADSRESAVRH